MIKGVRFWLMAVPAMMVVMTLVTALGLIGLDALGLVLPMTATNHLLAAALASPMLAAGPLLLLHDDGGVPR